MKYCRFTSAAAFFGLFIVLVCPLYAQSPGIERVSSLSHEIGKEVTVEGRTGYIVSESAGMHIFTLRDDYNNTVQVRSVGTQHPFMGVTYRVTGTPVRLNGTIYLDTADSLIAPVYPVTGPALPPPPPSLRSQILLYANFILLILAALGVLIWAMLRWTRRPPPEWGVLSVTSGPDRGLNVPLRRKKIAIGRGVSPARDIRLSSGDQTISNHHLSLNYRHGQLFVSDMSSNGTRIGGEKLMPGKSVPVNSGDLIHLGTRGTVIIVRLHAAPPAPGLLGLLRESVPLSDKTIILPEPPAEEPAWKNATADPVSDEILPYAAGDAPSAKPYLNGHSASAAQETTAQFDEETANPTAAHPARGEAEQSEEDEEDDIPHTFAPPLVFTFAGHDPKPSRLLGGDASETDDLEEGDQEQTAA